jgi:hypothetical protein
MSSNAKSSSDGSQNRIARGAFPRVPLKDTLELIRAIYALGHGENVRRVSVFDRLNRKPDSGTSRTMVSSANSGYELINGGRMPNT